MKKAALTKQAANKMFSKKALTMITLVELIIFVLLFLLVGLPIASKLIGFFSGQPETGTTKSLATLRTEIDHLEENEERTIPLYIDDNHIIKGFLINSKQRPRDCEPTLAGEKRKACFCVCKKETCDQIKGEVNVCQKVEYDLKEEYVLKAKFDEEGNEKPYNCVIKREKTDEKSAITISC